MDDILFENRNKGYGAYFLRKQYNKLLLKALIITLSAFLLLILMPYLIGLFHKEPVMDINSIQVEELPVQITDIPNLAPPSAPPPLETAKQPAVQIKDSTAEKPDDKKDTAHVAAKSDKGKIDSIGTNQNGVNGGQDTGKVYISVQKVPSFPGGMDQMHTYLTNNIHYQPNDFPGNVPNKVTINMIIEKDGSISHITISHPSPKNIENEALRVVKMMPRWQPGMNQDKPVRVFVRFAINFPRKN